MKERERINERTVDYHPTRLGLPGRSSEHVVEGARGSGNQRSVPLGRGLTACALRRQFRISALYVCCMFLFVTLLLVRVALDMCLYVPASP